MKPKLLTLSAVTLSQRKIQEVLTALHTSTQTGSQVSSACGLSLSLRLCSTSSCKFIFPAPPCQCHPVFLWPYRPLQVNWVSFPHCDDSQYYHRVPTLQSQISEPLENTSLVQHKEQHKLSTGLLGLKSRENCDQPISLTPLLFHITELRAYLSTFKLLFVKDYQEATSMN